LFFGSLRFDGWLRDWLYGWLRCWLPCERSLNPTEGLACRVRSAVELFQGCPAIATQVYFPLDSFSRVVIGKK